MDSCFTIRVAGRKKLVVRGDLIIKIYRRLAKKRYLRGKHTYEHERIYVPIPSTLHDIVRPFLRLNERFVAQLNVEKFEITKEGRIKFCHPSDTHDDMLWAFALAVYATKRDETGIILF